MTLDAVILLYLCNNTRHQANNACSKRLVGGRCFNPTGRGITS